MEPSKSLRGSRSTRTSGAGRRAETRRSRPTHVPLRCPLSSGHFWPPRCCLLLRWALWYLGFQPKACADRHRRVASESRRGCNASAGRLIDEQINGRLVSLIGCLSGRPWVVGVGCYSWMTRSPPWPPICGGCGREMREATVHGPSALPARHPAGMETRPEDWEGRAERGRRVLGWARLTAPGQQSW